MKTLKSMTVRDLIDELSTHDEDAIVVFACDYGDIGHTKQALPIGLVEELDTDYERIEESAYSNSDFAIEEVEDEDGEGEEYTGPDYVVLS